jgi:transposase-like protein
MGKARFSDDFKLDAIKQITERGYSVADVSQRLGVSTHSLYGWIKRYAASPGAAVKDDHPAEIRRLKTELARVTEERDIQKKPPRILPRMQSEVRVRCQSSPAVLGAGDVPVPAHPTERLLCLAEEPAEQAGKGRCSPGAHPQGLEGQRQGVWLSQAA